MESRTKLALGLGTVALSAVFGLALWDQLPTTMATHWNAAGEVDGTTSRPVAVALLPALSLLVLVVYGLLPRIDPRGENYATFRAAYDWLALGIVGFLSYVHVVVLLWNAGWEFTIVQAIAPAMAALYYVVGAVVDRAEPNWFVGVRTPWTLSDERVWQRTHDRAGPLFKAAGAVALAGVVVPSLALWLVVVPALVVVGYAVAYSFREYRRLSGRRA